MRLFIGIPLSPALHDQLAAIAQRLRRADGGLRWSSPEGWHITLQFLGAATSGQMDCVIASLRRVASPRVPIRLGALGAFDRAGAFLIEVQPTPELLALQQQVTRATMPCGFTPEDRPYHPHITLARNKGRSNGIRSLKPHIGSTPLLSGFAADEFLLYESILGPSGSRYEVKEHFSLGA